jgi:plastocyanin
MAIDAGAPRDTTESMKNRFRDGQAVFVACLTLTLAPTVSADEDVFWDSEYGFDPSVVQIHQGEAVFWTNFDFYGIDTQVIFNNGFSFFLEWYETVGVTFPFTGNYSYISTSGDRGVVIVLELPPTGIVIESPRVEGSQFIFDVSGLSFGKTNVVQVSTNLTAWVSVSTNENLSATMSFTNNANRPAAFYRVIELE